MRQRNDSKRIRLTLGMLAVLGLMVGSIASEAHAQWTQWGGNDMSFKSDSKGLATTWPTDGPRKIWKRDLGDGYSSVLFDKGVLYTMYRKGKKEFAIALDAKTGKTMWEYGYLAAPRKGHRKEFGEGPRSTPLLVDGHLYTIGVAGKMHCLKASDGKKVWTVNVWNKYKGNFPRYGYSSSPIAYGDKVIVLVGGKNASVVALNKSDGKLAWKSQSFENSYSTPKIISVGGEDQLMTFLDKAVVGLDPNTGKLKWKYDIDGFNMCQPYWNAEQGILFLSSAGAGARGLKLTVADGVTNVEELWTSNKVQFSHVNSIGVGDYVYGSSGTRASILKAINVTNGEVAWQERGFTKATCVYADGRLIVLDEDGQLGIGTATPEGFSLQSKFKVFDGVSWTVPTLVGKTLYLRDMAEIVALDLG